MDARQRIAHLTDGETFTEIGALTGPKPADMLVGLRTAARRVTGPVEPKGRVGNLF